MSLAPDYDHDFDPLSRVSRSLQDRGASTPKTGYLYDALDNVVRVTDPHNLMTKITKVLAALLLTASPFLAVSAAEVYRYSDPLFPAKRLALRISDKQFTVADMAEDLYVCGKESEFHCVRSATFKFEIPKVIKSGQRSWAVDGRNYQIEAIEKYSLRGATEELMRIREENASSSSIYLYSLKRGLVGIGFVNKSDRTYSTYLLEESCGFGASEVCPSTLEALDR